MTSVDPEQRSETALQSSETPHSKTPSPDTLRSLYLERRETHRSLKRRLWQMLPKPCMKESGERLGFLQDGALVFDTEDEVAILSDYAIYDYRLGAGTTAVERLHRRPPAELGALELEVLQAMSQARFTFLRVLGVLPNLGAVVEDELYGSSYALVDRTFSQHAKAGTTLACRILIFPLFAMTTAAGFVVSRTFADETLAQLNTAFGGPVAPKMQTLASAERAKLTAGIIRATRSLDAANSAIFQTKNGETGSSG